MSERQVIWVRAGVTTFTCLCEECLAEPEPKVETLAYRAAKVAGRLRAEADVGFTRCHRGHPISIRRVGRTAA
ncbi:MAG: hypothetical protein H0W87_02565 [Actinobacteria bacterium]|nr:hypothetical protein [Actinomycetota bacterium]